MNSGRIVFQCQEEDKKKIIFAIHYALQLAEEVMVQRNDPMAHIIYDIRNNQPSVTFNESPAN